MLWLFSVRTWNYVRVPSLSPPEEGAAAARRGGPHTALWCTSKRHITTLRTPDPTLTTSGSIPVQTNARNIQRTDEYA
eukprot:gene578-biopygen7028